MPELEDARGQERNCLLIDLGNSRVKWIGAVWHPMTGHWDLDVTTFGEGGVNDLGAALDSGALMPPEEVLLCSVASDQRSAAVEDAIAERSPAGVVRLRAEPESCGIRNGYRKPAKLGADRWMAVVAAARRHGMPVVVMDLGTATTLDGVDDEGRHLGGLILPGPRSMLEALAGKTALDPDITSGLIGQKTIAEPGKPQQDTPSAIEGGVVAAQLGALAQFVSRFEEHLGDKAAARTRVVVTGGGAGAILKVSDYQLTHDPLLVFRGMLLCRYGSGDDQLQHQGSQFREER